jgi:multidrug resistance efflux pump
MPKLHPKLNIDSLNTECEISTFSESSEPAPVLQPAHPSNENSAFSAKQSAAPRRLRNAIRPAVLARVSLAVLALGLAGAYLYDRLMLNVSIDAVVSAPLTHIRSSVDGRVSLRPNVEPGGSVEKGAELLSVFDDRADERTLIELNSKLSSAAENVRSIEKRMSSLQVLEAELHLRVNAHRIATISRSQAMVAEIEAAREGARAKASLAAGERSRAEELLGRGVISKAKVDEFTTQEAQAAAEVRRLDATSIRIRAELESAQKGIIIGEGYSDSPYSRQRIDELRMRLAEIAAERDSAVSSEKQLKNLIAAEERRLKQMTQDTVISPASGVLWNVRVGEGGRVSKGDDIADFVDCSQAFVEATVSERGYGTIRPGDSVSVRLSGSSTDIDGVIRSVRGSGANVVGLNRAAGLEHLPSGMMAVVVSMNSDVFRVPGCQLGRSAKVYFNDKENDLSQPKYIYFEWLTSGLSNLVSKAYAAGAFLQGSRASEPSTL